MRQAEPSVTARPPAGGIQLSKRQLLGAIALLMLLGMGAGGLLFSFIGVEDDPGVEAMDGRSGLGSSMPGSKKRRRRPIDRFMAMLGLKPEERRPVFPKGQSAPGSAPAAGAAPGDGARGGGPGGTVEEYVVPEIGGANFFGYGIDQHSPTGAQMTASAGGEAWAGAPRSAPVAATSGLKRVEVAGGTGSKLKGLAPFRWNPRAAPGSQTAAYMQAMFGGGGTALTGASPSTIKSPPQPETRIDKSKRVATTAMPGVPEVGEPEEARGGQSVAIEPTAATMDMEAGNEVNFTVSNLDVSRTVVCYEVVAHPNVPSAVNAGSCKNSSNYSSFDGNSDWTYSNGKWHGHFPYEPALWGAEGIKVMLSFRDRITGDTASATMEVVNSATP